MTSSNKKEGKMAQKPVKKTAAKTAVKPAAKKTAVKKVAAKKPTVKAAAPKDVKEVIAPAPEMHACGCGADCKCGADCACHNGKSCHGGCKFGRFIKKLLLVLIAFALGFAAAKMCCCDKPCMRGPRVHFVEGCMDVSSVKCPKMQEALPMMDINQDGCITREEYREFKKAVRDEVREMRAEMND